MLLKERHSARLSRGPAKTIITSKVEALLGGPRFPMVLARQALTTLARKMWAADDRVTGSMSMILNKDLTAGFWFPLHHGHFLCSFTTQPWKWQIREITNRCTGNCMHLHVFLKSEVQYGSKTTGANSQVRGKE